MLRLVGEVDVATQLQYRAEADALLLDDQVTRLVVDLRETTLIDSSGLGLLVHLKMLACDNALSVALRAVPPRIRSLLSLAGLDRVFDIEPDEQPEAEQSPAPDQSAERTDGGAGQPA